MLRSLVGSEMCIRDRLKSSIIPNWTPPPPPRPPPPMSSTMVPAPAVAPSLSVDSSEALLVSSSSSSLKTPGSFPSRVRVQNPVPRDRPLDVSSEVQFPPLPTPSLPPTPVPPSYSSRGRLKKPRVRLDLYRRRRAFIYANFFIMVVPLTFMLILYCLLYTSPSPRDS